MKKIMIADASKKAWGSVWEVFQTIPKGPLKARGFFTCRLSEPFLKDKNAEVITRINTPMFLLLASHRGKKSLERLAVLAKKAGRRSITLPKRFLRWRRMRNGSHILAKLQDGDHKRQGYREPLDGHEMEKIVMPLSMRRSF